MVAQPTRVPFVREMLPVLSEAGLLPGHTYELLDGHLYEMPLESPLHAYVTEVLAQAFAPLGYVRRGTPFLLGDDDVNPDLALVEGGMSDYKYRFPDAARFVVEVSVFTLAHDLGLKASAYARTGVETYWVVDLDGRTTHVHTDPSTNGYARTETVPFEIHLTFAGVTVNLADLVA